MQVETSEATVYRHTTFPRCSRNSTIGMKLPSDSYFSRPATPALYTQLCKSVKCMLYNNVAFFACMIDLWTSRSSDPYFSLMVHYIDAGWNIRSHCLQTHYISKDHTRDNIKESMQEAIQECNLDDYGLVAITTDSGWLYAMGWRNPTTLTSSAGPRCQQLTRSGEGLTLESTGWLMNWDNINGKCFECVVGWVRVVAPFATRGLASTKRYCRDLVLQSIHCWYII